MVTDNPMERIGDGQWKIQWKELVMVTENPMERIGDGQGKSNTHKH